MSRFLSQITLISEFSFSSEKTNSSKGKSFSKDADSFSNAMIELSGGKNKKKDISQTDEKYFQENDDVNPGLFSFVTEGINSNSQIKCYNFSDKKIHINEKVCKDDFEFTFKLNKKIHFIHTEKKLENCFYLTMKVNKISVLFGNANVGVIAFNIVLALNDIDGRKIKKEKDPKSIIKNDCIVPELLEKAVYILKRQNCSIAKGYCPNLDILGNMIFPKEEKEISSLLELIASESALPETKKTNIQNSTKTYLFTISKKPHKPVEGAKDNTIEVEEILERFSFPALQEKILSIISEKSGLTITSFFHHKKKNFDPHSINYFTFTQTALDNDSDYKKHLGNLAFAVTNEYYLRQDEIVKDFSVFNSVHFGISAEGVSAILCLTGNQTTDVTLSDNVFPSFSNKYLPIILISRLQLVAALSMTEMVVNTSKKNWGKMLYDWQQYQTSTIFTCISDKMQFQKLYEICNESFEVTTLNLNIRQTLEAMADAQNEKRQKYNSILLTAIPIVSLIVSIIQLIPFFTR